MDTIRISRPTSSAVLKFALGTALLLGAAAFTQARAELPPAHHQGNIAYVSGGIGLDESTSFKEAMAQYPLALTFASMSDGRGAYVSEVQVVIRDSHDANVLNVASDGPYFLVKLPAGSYEVFATYNNETQSHKVTVGDKGSARATFTWNRPKSGPD